ncbi:glycogen/starch/alpha-glucan phosphorylase [Massilia psychrophila]|uniref:Alpha-1,4 glucan phosphorylase n=1 Tax=Massilia psychrophila TaxID=1603353 RepID=A0A2G8T169_9BURK|nr:glycogen/starch/alpha-glucan phosphorylase [Massilia psychrophila]PIL39769.1 glycogen phosphorylase [Massilia psychrophila]GGE63343.1 alpha-1,4 glucan phosphorylase [Massilia psychrophila]
MNLTDFQYDNLANDVAHLKLSIANKLIYTVGKDPVTAQPQDWLQATALAVRDRLVERWMKTTRAQYKQDVKRVYYLSMEFLIGRTFTNALLALDIYQNVQQALTEMDVDFDQLVDLEHDAALGNGGLGRLAACFLDSMATLGLSGFGYGIRYDYGMFKQQIIDGHQVEVPDYWLTGGNPWEFPRPEVQYRVRFGGRLEQDGETVRWLDTQDVLATAYDTIIPGYATETTNTLRLWSAKASSEINLSAFNQGNYMAAVEDKNHSENVSRVLYPDDSTLSGRELRLRQEYFFCAASLQDLIHRYLRTHSSFDQLPDHVAIHLNDTHPVLAIPELMRLLVDEHHVKWPQAWALTQKVFSYTNHTLMQEALETWPVDLLGRVLPRHLHIIFDINAGFIANITATFGADIALMRRVSLIDEQGERRVRMAYLAVVASHKINGVSALHSELMKQSIFADFAKVFPDRFNNKTNGVTPRRWLSQANPSLSRLIDDRIGRDWRRHLEQLSGLKDIAGDAVFGAQFRAAKLANKVRLTNWVATNLGLALDPASLFDVQIKRIHEYKRQLLNVLHVITRYNRILANPDADWVPRTVVFAGKAASAYHMAKQTIKLINDVAVTINNDARLKDQLKVVFIPNYSVSLAEIIIPAADLSEQISTAGTEASGTGNMKFALNGALTIGTLDGANVEMRDSVGADNIFIFGNTTHEVDALRTHGYQPRLIYEHNAELKLVLDQLRDGVFSPSDKGRFQPICDTLLNWGDHYLLLADYASYVATQDQVDELYRQPDEWTRKAILNVAGMGIFSSDRTIAEYAGQIWHAAPIKL